MSDNNSTNQHIEAEATVPAALAGQRFDKIAAQLFSEYSRAELSRWIEAGALTANGAILRGKTRLVGGEDLRLAADKPVREAWQEAQDIALDVVYEDADLLVLNKPAGLVVHPGAGNPAGTLLNGLLHYRPALKQLPRAGLVHRLDKDTSGLLMVAGSAAAQRVLAQSISQRQVKREYAGICEGRMVSGQDVDQPIGRHPQVRTRQAVREDGKPAFTEFRVLERFRAHTLVRARLGTGRTHQIRVHLQSIGHPLVGDRRYGARTRLPVAATPALITALQGFPRHALHAQQLQLAHPLSGQLLSFSAPLPADMTALLDLLAAGQDALSQGMSDV
ncbi:MAG: 23S rRNA pseudouridine(1911/1915/1917) synthase RluD [Pseudomonadota bacterium]